MRYYFILIFICLMCSCTQDVSFMGIRPGMTISEVISIAEENENIIGLSPSQDEFFPNDNLTLNYTFHSNLRPDGVSQDIPFDCRISGYKDIVASIICSTHSCWANDEIIHLYYTKYKKPSLFVASKYNMDAIKKNDLLNIQICDTITEKDIDQYIQKKYTINYIWNIGTNSIRLSANDGLLMIFYQDDKINKRMFDFFETEYEKDLRSKQNI